MNNLFITLQLVQNTGFDSKIVEKFNPEAYFVSRLYSRFISHVKIPNLKRISIVLCDFPYHESIIPPISLVKVCVIDKYVDLTNYNKETEQLLRYQILLDIIIETINVLCEKFDWDLDPFVLAYNQTLSINFENKYILIGTKYSSNK